MLHHYYKLLITNYQLLITTTAMLLPAYLIRFSIVGIPTNLLEVVIITVFLIGITSQAIRAQWKKAIQDFSRPLAVLVGLFLISAVISTLISPHLNTSLGILKGWIIIPMLFGWIIYASSPEVKAGREANQKKLPITDYRLPIILALFTMLVFGLTDTIFWKNDLATLHWTLIALILANGRIAPRYALRVTHYLIVSGVIVALLGISQIGTLDRITSIYPIPNSLALFLAPLTVMAYFWKLEIGNWKFGRWPAAVMFLAIVFTQSLMGVASIIFTLAVGALVIKKLGFDWSLPAGRSLGEGWGIGHWSLIAAIVIIGATILYPKIEYLQQPGSSAHVRLQLWSVSLDLIKDHPLLGTGLGTFEPAYQQKLHQRFQEFKNCSLETSLKIENCKLKIKHKPLREFVFRDPHNWPLSFWLNTGLLGLTSFVAIHGILILSIKLWLPQFVCKLRTNRIQNKPRRKR